MLLFEDDLSTGRKGKPQEMRRPPRKDERRRGIETETRDIPVVPKQIFSSRGGGAAAGVAAGDETKSYSVSFTASCLWDTSASCNCCSYC